MYTCDKIKHYNFCYDLTAKFPLPLRPVAGLLVFFAVSFLKEIVWDLFLKKGNFDTLDLFANLSGVVDAIDNRGKQF